MAEDCLFANVWRPSPIHPGNGNGTEAAPPAPPLAVMVWVHGGGFLAGAASVGWYDGAALARAGNVIVVSFNYRLGPLGFLQVPTAGAGGMNGLRDQVMALGGCASTRAPSGAIHHA